VSDSKYGSPTFIVPKKDGGHRIIQDYRELNQHTETNVTPLPNMATAIQDLADCTLFSKFDIRDSYYNIQVVPEDRWKKGSTLTGDTMSSMSCLKALKVHLPPLLETLAKICNPCIENTLPISSDTTWIT
jgi:hypothetical protein